MRKWNYVAMGQIGFQGSRRSGKAVSQLDLEKDRTPGGQVLAHRGRISRHLFDRLPPHGRLCRRCREKGRTFVKDAGSLNYRECHQCDTACRRALPVVRVADTSGCSPGVGQARDAATSLGNRLFEIGFCRGRVQLESAISVRNRP